jgi:hypothetical protein
VGSNTETDDDCRPATFHRVAFGVKAPFSTEEYHGDVKQQIIEMMYVVANKKKIASIGVVTRFVPLQNCALLSTFKHF